MKKLGLVLMATMLPILVLAAEGHGAGHEEGIPTDVYFQTINFLIFAGLIVYFARTPVRHYFENRQANYKQALARAETARKEAERQKAEIEKRLHALESGSQASIAQARKEAEELRQRIVHEAQELSGKLREDAKRSAEIELQRAKIELREEVLNQAVAAAKKVLTEKIADADQKRLQTEFVDKIQEVR